MFILFIVTVNIYTANESLYILTRLLSPLSSLSPFCLGIHNCAVIVNARVFNLEITKM